MSTNLFGEQVEEEVWQDQALPTIVRTGISALDDSGFFSFGQLTILMGDPDIAKCFLELLSNRLNALVRTAGNDGYSGVHELVTFQKQKKFVLYKNMNPQLGMGANEVLLDQNVGIITTCNDTELINQVAWSKGKVIKIYAVENGLNGLFVVEQRWPSLSPKRMVIL